MSPEKLKLAVVAGAMSDDLRSASTVSRKSGFAGVQLDARTANVDLTELSASGLREVRNIFSAQDQQLVGLRHEFSNKGMAPGADVDRELSRLGRVMDAARGLGAALVCVDLGPLPVPAAHEPEKPAVTSQLAGLILLPSADDRAAAAAAHLTPSRPQPPPDPAFVSQVDAALFELGRIADRVGVMLALRSELSPLSAVERALRVASCPWFGVDLDPAAVVADARDLDEVFSAIGPLVRHVRARDAIAGADRRTKPAAIGRGGVNWGDLLANLDAADYTGWITLDTLELTDRAAAAIAGAKHLRQLL